MSYTYDQLKKLWIDAGGNPQAADVAAATALAESGGRPDATNSNGNGSVDKGLWQINTVHGSQATFDPMANARAAIAISNNGANWRPWCTAYTDGACGTKGGTFSPTGNSPVGRFLGGRGSVPTGNPGTGGGNTGGGTGATPTQSASWFDTGISTFISHLADVILNNIFYGLVSVGGIFIMGVGLMIVIQEGAGGASTTAAIGVAKKLARVA